MDLSDSYYKKKLITELHRQNRRLRRLQDYPNADETREHSRPYAGQGEKDIDHVNGAKPMMGFIPKEETFEESAAESTNTWRGITFLEDRSGLGGRALGWVAEHGRRWAEGLSLVLKSFLVSFLISCEVQYLGLFLGI